MNIESSNFTILSFSIIWRIRKNRRWPLRKSAESAFFVFLCICSWENNLFYIPENYVKISLHSSTRNFQRMFTKEKNGYTQNAGNPTIFSKNWQKNPTVFIHFYSLLNVFARFYSFEIILMGLLSSFLLVFTIRYRFFLVSTRFMTFLLVSTHFILISTRFLLVSTGFLHVSTRFYSFLVISTQFTIYQTRDIG